MTNEPKNASRRWAVGLLLVFIAFAGALVLGPYFKDHAMGSELAMARSQLGALEGRVLRETKSSIKAANASPSFDVAQIFLPGSTASIAGARLQDRLTQLLNRHGGRTTSARVLPASESRETDLVAVNLTASLGMKALRDVLYAIETSIPLLYVDAISISVPGSNRKRRRKSGPIVLKVTIEVSGYKSGGPAI